jgi:hypothetical protein
MRGPATPQEVDADAGSSDGDDAHPLVGAVAEFISQPVTVREGVGVEPGGVSGELVVGFGPIPDGRESGAEGVGHDVARVADK